MTRKTEKKQDKSENKDKEKKKEKLEQENGEARKHYSCNDMHNFHKKKKKKLSSNFLAKYITKII